MTHRLLPLLCLLTGLLFAFPVSGQKAQWLDAKSLTDNGDIQSFFSDVDEDGNVYAVGSFRGAIDFDGFKDTASGSFGQDGFAYKADKSGKVLWLTTFKSTSNVLMQAVAFSPDGGMAASGDFFQKITIGDSTYTSGGSYDAFAVKLDSNGKVEWTNIATGNSLQQTKAITFDENGSLYWTGIYFGTTKVGGRSVNGGGGNYDFWLAQIRPNGQLRRLQGYGGSSSDQSAILASYKNSVYIAGIFYSSISFGSKTISSSGFSDIFFCRFDTTLKLNYALGAGGNSTESVTAMKISKKGELLMAGNFNSQFKMGTLSISGSNNDLWFARLRSNGVPYYLNALKGQGTFSQVYITDIDINKDDYAFVSGYFMNRIAAGKVTLNSQGSNDVFVASYDNKGDLFWMLRGGDNLNETSRGMHVDSTGLIYLSGYYSNSTEFGKAKLTNGGNNSYFLATCVPPLKKPSLANIATKYVYAGQTFKGTYDLNTPVPTYYELLKAPAGTKFTSSTATIEYQTDSKDRGIVEFELRAENLAGIDTGTARIDVISYPKASIVSSKDVCFGDSMAFKNDSDYFGPLSYFWDFGDGTKSQIEKPWHTFPKDSQYVVRLIIKNVFGETDTTFDTVQVLPNPKASFTIKNACAGDSLPLVDNSILNGASLKTRKWYRDGVLIETAAQFKNYEGKKAKPTYSLAIESARGCRDSISKSIEVTKPVASYITYNACAGDEVLFFDVNPNQDSITSYYWQFGDGKTKTVNYSGMSHRYKIGGTYTSKLIVTSNRGCQDSLTRTFDVLDKPEAKFQIEDLCLGDRLKLEDISNPVKGSIINRRWTTGDGTSYNKALQFHKYKNSGKFSISLIVINSNNCADTMIQSVNVSPRPKIAFERTDSCRGNLTLISNKSTPGTGDAFSSYKWMVNDSLKSTGRSFYTRFYATGTNRVKLVTTTTNGCRDSIVKSVNVHEKVQASFTLNPVCENDTVLINESFSDSLLDSISWIGFGMSVFESSGDYYAVAREKDNHVLFARTFAINGCQDSSSIEPEVYKTPKTNIVLNKINHWEKSVELDAEDDTYDTYIWNLGDGIVKNGVPLAYTYGDTTNTVTVQLITRSDRNCISTAYYTIEFDDLSSIRDSENAYELFPNPATSFVRITGIPQNTGYRLLDLQGRAVREGQLSNGLLHIAELPDGQYILRLTELGAQLPIIKN